MWCIRDSLRFRQMGAPKGNTNGKQFQPGQSGNPAGRPSAGMSVIEWWNQMREYTVEQLQAVANDESVAQLKRRAAREMLDDKGHSLDRILDRTQGKPSQSMDITADATIRVRFADEDSVKQAQMYTDKPDDA